MRVQVRKAFPYSLDGNTRVVALPGEIHEGRVARWALELGDGLELPPAAPAAPAPAPVERDAGAAPRDKAADKAPRNKGAR